MIKVFLGGTCCESAWRKKLIKLLDNDKISWYDPVVPDWTPECQEKEEIYKLGSDYNLYVITPKMLGVFSIAEATHDAAKLPQNTIFCVLKEDNGEEFNKAQWKSLMATKKLIKHCGAYVFDTLDEIGVFLNG